MGSNNSSAIITDNNISGICNSCANGTNNDECKLFISNIVNKDFVNEFVQKSKYDAIEKELNEWKEMNNSNKKESNEKLNNLLSITNDERVVELTKINQELTNENDKLSSENISLKRENSELNSRLESTITTSQGMQMAADEIKKSEENQKISEQEAQKRLQEAEERVDFFYRLKNYFNKNFKDIITNIECIDEYIFYNIKVDSTIESFFNSDTHPLSRLWSLKIEIGEYNSDGSWNKTDKYAIIYNKNWEQCFFNGWDLGKSARNPIFYLGAFYIWWNKTYPNVKIKNLRTKSGYLATTNGWKLKNGTGLNNENCYKLLSVGFVNERIYTDIDSTITEAQGSKMPNTLVMHTGAFRINGSDIKKNEQLAIKGHFGSICRERGLDDDDRVGDCIECTGMVKNTKGPQYWNPNSPIPHIYMQNNGGSTIYNALYQEEPWREMVYCFGDGIDSKPVWMSVGFIAQKINNTKIYDMTTWLTNCGVQSDGSVSEGFCSNEPIKMNCLYIIIGIILFIILLCFVAAIIFKKHGFKIKSDFFLDINK
jgi:hypothetical protein